MLQCRNAGNCNKCINLIINNYNNSLIMNWKNVNLTSPYEASRNILEPYSFDAILLEIACNVREINEDTVRAQFEISVRDKINEAREIFAANLKNITTEAIKHRNTQ